MSYREANELTPSQIYVAFGKTTKASMVYLKKVEVLKAPNEHAVIEFWKINLTGSTEVLLFFQDLQEVLVSGKICGTEQ